MAKASETYQINLPANICYDLFLQSSRQLRDFQIPILSKEHLQMQLTTGTNWGSGKITINVFFEAREGNKTIIALDGSILGMMDIRGLINKAIKKLVDPFMVSVDRTIKAHMQAGLVCPKCHRPIPSGAKFCPEDGTPISRACDNCGTFNSPGTKFCTNCGHSL